MMHRLPIAFLLLIIWSACANRVPPSGGPKDEQPPTLVGSIPKNGNINVKSTEITLLFDELVVAKNIKKELLITPRIDFDYEYKIKKNSVILSLEEPLDSATTYTFNFRNAIVDITESNPVLDLVIAFSTGPILDTLQLNGNIHDLFTEKPSENVIVGLYKINDTTNLFNTPPYYLTKSDKKGNYLFRNLKSDDYVLNAFVDGNNNLICDSDRELYAFTDSFVKLDSTMVADTLRLQLLNMDTLALKRTRNTGKYFIAVTNKYITDLELKAANDSTLWYSLDKNHKEIKIYNTFDIKDSLLVELKMTDSLNIAVKDTFYLKFPPSERKYDEYDISLDELEIFPEKKSISFNINTSKPSRFIYKDSIRINSDSSRFSFDSTWNISVDASNTKFKFKNQLPKTYLDSLNPSTSTDNNETTSKGRSDLGNKPVGRGSLDPSTASDNSTSKLTYMLNIPFGTFQSVESDSSKQIESKLSPKYTKDFGILMGEITTQHSHYFIQLLDKDYQLIDELPQASSYKFRNIVPGDYYIRIMIDTNKNGKWDAGNIYLNQLPEPIIIYKNEEGTSLTSIRANWEISLDLHF